MLMPHDENQHVIRDVPVFQYFLGLVFAAAGVMLLQAGGAPLFGGIFAAIGAGFLLFSNNLTVRADKKSGTLRLDYRSILRHTWKEVAIDEIDGINVERNRGGKGGFTYRVTVLKKDGQVIPFRSTSSSGYGAKERIAGQLRAFLGIQESNRIVGGILPSQLTQAFEIHETDGVHWQIQPLYTSQTSTPTGARWHSPDFRTPGQFLFVTQKAEGQSSTGFLASLGNLMIRQALTFHGFSADDTPGLDRAVLLDINESDLDRHFMAYTNAPSTASPLLNARIVALMVHWAKQYPLKTFQRGPGTGQLMILFGPKGLYLATMNLAQPEQVHELTALGMEMVNNLRVGHEEVGSLP